MRILLYMLPAAASGCYLVYVLHDALFTMTSLYTPRFIILHLRCWRCYNAHFLYLLIPAPLPHHSPNFTAESPRRPRRPLDARRTFQHDIFISLRASLALASLTVGVATGQLFIAHASRDFRWSQRREARPIIMICDVSRLCHIYADFSISLPL